MRWLFNRWLMATRVFRLAVASDRMAEHDRKDIDAWLQEVDRIRIPPSREAELRSMAARVLARPLEDALAPTEEDTICRLIAAYASAVTSRERFEEALKLHHGRWQAASEEEE